MHVNPLQPIASVRQGKVEHTPPKNTSSAHHHAARQLEQSFPTHSLTRMSVVIPNTIDVTPPVFKAHSHLHRPPLT